MIEIISKFKLGNKYHVARRSSATVKFFGCHLCRQRCLIFDALEFIQQLNFLIVLLFCSIDISQKEPFEAFSLKRDKTAAKPTARQ